MKSLIKNFIAKMVAGRSDDGIMITLSDPKKVDFQAAMLEDLLMRNGIDPRAITNETQLKNIINQIKAVEAQAATAPSGIKTIKIKTIEPGKVFDMEGKQIPRGSDIMGGKAVPGTSDRERVRNEMKKKYGFTDERLDEIENTPVDEKMADDLLREDDERIIKERLEKQNKDSVQKILDRKNREDVYGLEDYDTTNMSDIQKEIIRTETKLGNLNPNTPGFRDRAKPLIDKIEALKNKMRDDKAMGGRIGYKIGAGKKGVQGLIDLIRNKFGKKSITTADKAPIPPKTLERDMFKKSEERFNKTDSDIYEDSLKGLEDLGAPKLAERFRLKRKYPGITDDLLDKILIDDNMQRKAEVLATIDEAFKMMEKGKGADEILDTMKNVTRTKQADGGRIGLKAGMTKRAFLKLMGGVGASIGAAKSGIFSGLGKGATKEVAKEVVQQSTTTPPSYFFKLAEKIKKFGSDSTPTTERTISKSLKSKDGTADYILEEDMVTGDIQIKKVNMERDDMINDIEIMEFRKGEVVKGPDGKPIRTPDEYDEVTESISRIYKDSFNDPDYSEGIRVKEVMEEVMDPPSIKKASGGIARMLGE